MISTALRELMGSELSSALDKKGYDALTPVQEAVLDPALAGRDLRISSQTGSGKTLAIGLIVREEAAREVEAPDGKAKPNALVIVPTRELAKQVEEELRWFYADLGALVVSVTGGSSYRDERRALGRGPAVVVGTPGRLLDYLERGGIDPSAISAVVLDEADRMLDLGFREALESILGYAPEEHRTHLVSATFPPDVKGLADRVQQDPAHVQGTPLGSANADIDHVVHLVAPTERVAAMINLLLAQPEGQTLVFARTRADVAEIAGYLEDAGFRVTSLSGEMEQRERIRALAAFKRGDLHALVATDVAARGIDVQDIARVIHAEPPTDADTYTHRSGRTGRAGRKGTSSVIAMPSQLSWAKLLLKRARVPFRFEPIPTAESIRRASDERLVEGLSNDDQVLDEGVLSLAERLVAEGDPVRAVAKLLLRVRNVGPAEPREVQVLVPSERPSRTGDRGRGRDRERPRRNEHDSRRDRDQGFEQARPRAESRSVSRGDARGDSRDWVPFRVTWGGEHGADPRRLLAIVCRRGGIRGGDVGAIDIQHNYSVVNVDRSVASSFAEEAKRPDPRDPRVRIAPFEASQAPFPRTAPPPVKEPAPEKIVKERRSVRDVGRAASSEEAVERPVAHEKPEKKAARSFDADAPKKFDKKFDKEAPRPFAKGRPKEFGKTRARDEEPSRGPKSIGETRVVRRPTDESTERSGGEKRPRAPRDDAFPKSSPKHAPKPSKKFGAKHDPKRKPSHGSAPPKRRPSR